MSQVSGELRGMNVMIDEKRRGWREREEEREEESRGGGGRGWMVNGWAINWDTRDCADPSRKDGPKRKIPTEPGGISGAEPSRNGFPPPTSR